MVKNIVLAIHFLKHFVNFTGRFYVGYFHHKTISFRVKYPYCSYDLKPVAWQFHSTLTCSKCNNYNLFVIVYEFLVFLWKLYIIFGWKCIHLRTCVKCCFIICFLKLRWNSRQIKAKSEAEVPWMQKFIIIVLVVRFGNIIVVKILFVVLFEEFIAKFETCVRSKVQIRE